MLLNKKNISDFLDSTNKSFKIFDIKYSTDEKKTIKNVKIKPDYGWNNYDHYGTVKDMDIIPFLQKIGDNTDDNIEVLSNIISKLCSIVCEGYKTEYFWLSLRVTNPNNIFDIARWHQDGKYFMDSDKLQSKFITTLKGPGTLLLKPTKKNFELFKEINDNQRDEFLHL